MQILNLGCGSKTSADPRVINIDWSIALRVRRNPLFRLLAPLVFRGDRLNRLRALPANILVHDLSKGVPFADNSVDVAYHSHVIEHLDRDVAPIFTSEILRALKPGGVLRICAPDWERGCREYLMSVERCDHAPEMVQQHEQWIQALLRQSVQREASGTSQQKPLRRRLENLLLGDARKRGQTHQWMYDRHSLKLLLEQCGFSRVYVARYDDSLIADWDALGLDRLTDGREYKPGSIYVEGVK